MVCLGLEPRAAGWKAQTNPLSYGSPPPPPILCLSMLLIPVLYASLLLSSWCLFMSYAFECCRQGDQIWRNSTTLANNNKKLAMYLRFIWFLAKFSAYFGTICMILGAFSLLKIAKYWNRNLVIWSHWLWTKKVNLSFARSMFKSTRSWFEIWSPKGQHWHKIKLHFVHKSKKNCVYKLFTLLVRLNFYN